MYASRKISCELNKKNSIENKFEALAEELKSYWREWDDAIEGEDAKRQVIARDKMVDLLNRRTYVRNLVRDVNEALGN